MTATVSTTGTGTRTASARSTAARSTAASPPFGEGIRGNRWNELDGRTPHPLPSVSVIVVHYRQQAELDRTLAALARQTYPAPLLEIVVVDDGSPEAPTVPPGVRLVRQADEGFRVAAARNLGVRSSTGDVLCFLDADTSPEPDYVERITRLPALAPEAVTVGRRRHADLAALPVDADLAAVAPERELPEPQWLIDAYDRSGDLLAADDRSYRYVIGAVTAVTRWFFDQTGGYDESFRGYGGEDWQWAHRAWVAGGVFAHVRDAVAWHDGPEWSGRSDDVERRRRAKNAETLLLADHIPIAGSRGRALRTSITDVEVRLAAAPSIAAAFVCVDSVLVALPQATVVVPDEFAPAFRSDQRVVALTAAAARATPPLRVVVELPTALRVHDAGAAVLAGYCAEVGVGGLGTVEVEVGDGDGDGDEPAEIGPALTIVSNRALERARRWQRDDLFSTRRVTAPWLTTLVDEPDVAAYLGGWA